MIPASFAFCSRFLTALPVAALALFCLLGSAAASQGNQATPATTIVTGKVIATVIRAQPLPFNAVIDEVLVKPG
ncbi:MAG: hypothetical protein Q4F27_06000, partial [Desulfovibrionaceae bacterium]|nr:hypothetical protein [Desulfovibrionaceae bacterium]